jgi:hypothetical protein
MTFTGWGVAIGPTIVIPPSNGGMLNPNIYGPGIGYDTKANVNVGPIGSGGGNQKVAIKFKASTTSALNSVRWAQRGGPPHGGGAYSYGDGGTTSLSIQADDGAGHPSGTSLGSGSITTGNPTGDWETYTPVSMLPAPILTAGSIYYIVFTNPDANNNISVNNAYLYYNTTPRQPIFSDSEFGLMITDGSWGVLESNYLPVVDLAYANGTHDGNSYYEAMIDRYAAISGSTGMAREQFTVSGGNKTATGVGVRVRRSSGSSGLVVTLETSAGSAIESVTIPSSSVPISAPGGDTGGAVWVTANFVSSHVLINGSSYNVRVSTASGTTYTTFPIRAGGADQSIVSYAFTDGIGQVTTDGSNWTNMYFSPYQVDMQCYLTVA